MRLHSIALAILLCASVVGAEPGAGAELHSSGFAASCERMRALHAQKKAFFDEVDAQMRARHGNADQMCQYGRTVELPRLEQFRRYFTSLSREECYSTLAGDSTAQMLRDLEPALTQTIARDCQAARGMPGLR